MTLTRASLADRLASAERRLTDTGFAKGGDGLWRRGKQRAEIKQLKAEGVPEMMRHPSTGIMVPTPPEFFEDKVLIEYGFDA